MSAILLQTISGFGPSINCICSGAWRKLAVSRLDSDEKASGCLVLSLLPFLSSMSMAAMAISAGETQKVSSRSRYEKKQIKLALVRISCAKPLTCYLVRFGSSYLATSSIL